MTAPLNLTFPQADAIIERLTTRVHELIGTDYRDAAIDAASRAEAAADRIGSAETVEGWVASAEASAETASGAAATATSAVRVEVDKLIAGAPEAFDTLKEISDELEKNETERAALATTIGKKADTDYVDDAAEEVLYRSQLSFTLEYETTTDNPSYATPQNGPPALRGGNAFQTRLPVGTWRLRLRGGDDYRWRVMLNGGRPRYKEVGEAELITEYEVATESNHILLGLNSDVPEGEKFYVDYFQVDPEKADRVHTHVSADITDAVGLTTTDTVGQLVKTSSTGNVQSYVDPTEARDLTRKYYVDREVAKKADIDELAKYDKAVVYLSFERTKTNWQWLVPSSPWWEPGSHNFTVPPGDYHVIVENAYYTATGIQFNALPVGEREVKMPDTKWYEFDISLPEGSSVQTQDSGGKIGERINILMIPTRMWEAFSVEFRRENEEQRATQKKYVDQETAKKADKDHEHSVDQVVGLADELGKKADADHTHSVGEIDGLQSELSRKASLEYVQEQVSNRPALFHGYGPPGAIEGAVPGDKYMDLDEMEIYVLPEENA